MNMQICRNNQLIFLANKNLGEEEWPSTQQKKASKLKEHLYKNLHIPHSK